MHRVTTRPGCTGSPSAIHTPGLRETKLSKAAVKGNNIIYCSERGCACLGNSRWRVAKIVLVEKKHYSSYMLMCITVLLSLFERCFQPHSAHKFNYFMSV